MTMRYKTRDWIVTRSRDLIDYCYVVPFYIYCDRP